jgi:hypothetical protein
MSYPAVPPSSEDPTAGLGSNRDGYTRSFDPPPPADPYLPPAPPLPPPVSAPPIPAYQPPPVPYPPVAPPPSSPYQPPSSPYQPPVAPYQPPVAPYQPPVAPPSTPYQPVAPAPYQPSYAPPPAYASQPFFPAAGGYPPPFPPMAVATTPTSSWSVAALVLGILGAFAWCTLGIPCVLAVIFGHLGLNETKLGAKSGRGMAIAGLVLGYVGLVATAAFFIWGIASDSAGTSP